MPQHAPLHDIRTFKPERHQSRYELPLGRFLKLVEWVLKETLQKHHNPQTPTFHRNKYLNFFNHELKI